MVSENPTVSLHAGYEVGGQFIDAYLARPEGKTGLPGVVLISGMFGLNWYQRQITRRFGEAGFVALSPDLFDGVIAPDRGTALRSKNSLDLGSAVEWISGAADFLHSLPWVEDQQSIGVVGFCLGGGLALLSLARSNAFGAGVIYYHSVFPDASEITKIDSPILAHFGTNDHTTPEEEIAAFRSQLEASGKRIEIEMYDGMGHGFVNTMADASPRRDKAANASLAKTFQFLHTELAAVK